MAESVVNRTNRDFSWVIQDAGAAHSYNAPINNGDFAFAAPLHETLRIRDNGTLHGIRKGDDQPLGCSFSCGLTDLGDDTDETLLDIIHDSGAIESTWVSTTLNESEIPTYDLVGTMDGTPFGEADKTITFPDLEFKGNVSIGKPGTVSVNAESATATKPTVA